MLALIWLGIAASITVLILLSPRLADLIHRWAFPMRSAPLWEKLAYRLAVLAVIGGVAWGDLAGWYGTITYPGHAVAYVGRCGVDVATMRPTCHLPARSS
jgi:hypothetical protein